MSIHLVKLVVGVESLDHFYEVQNRYAETYKGQSVHSIWTRHFPKQIDDLIAHGSAYRVIKNKIQCRQKIVGYDKIDHPAKGKMCVIFTDTDIIRTAVTAKRPFQGWRYLKPADAPVDLGLYMPDDEAGGDEELREELESIGLL